MHLAWITDIHLNFPSAVEVENFLTTVGEIDPDAVLLTGDIGEARSVIPWLERLDDAWDRPIYYVLGNHDFYGGSIAAVRAGAVALSRDRPKLRYLTAMDVCELTRHVGLVGDDGWADARLGNYEQSLVMMNDYRLIAELAPLSKVARWPRLKELGDRAAEHIRRVLPRALDQYPQVLLATHVPPMREACWHEGRLSDDEWLPHFTCKAMGDAILEIMRGRPDRNLTIYCGHTHSSGICEPLANVKIHTGAAKYGMPVVQKVIEIGQ